MNKIKVITIATVFFLSAFMIADGAGLLKPGQGGGILTPFNVNNLQWTVGSPFVVGGSSSSTITGDGSQSTLASPLLVTGAVTASSSLTLSYKLISTSTVITNPTFFTGISSTSTLTLPSATSSKGLTLVFKDIGGTVPTSTIILQTSTSSQVIDSTSTLTLTTRFQAVRLFSDGLNWYQW